MSSSSELSNTLEVSLRELETKATTIEQLALEVKNNEKRLYDIANSTISYISQLKAKCNAKAITGPALADKLRAQMDKIISSLKTDPKKESIDRTLSELQGILQNKRSGAEGSGSGASAERSGASAERSGASAEGSGSGASAESSGAGAGRGTEGFFTDPVGRITQMFSGALDKNSSNDSVQLAVKDPPLSQSGGYRYSSPKKSKKTRRPRKKKSKGRGKKSKKSVTLSHNRRVKSHFTKTRKTRN